MFFSASFLYMQVLNLCLCYQTCEPCKDTNLEILAKTLEIPRDSIKNMDSFVVRSDKFFKE